MGATAPSGPAAASSEGLPPGVSRRVGRIVAVWGAVAGAVTAAVVVSPQARLGQTSVQLAVALGAALLVTTFLEVNVERRAMSESSNFMEVVALPLMVLLAPAMVVLVMLATAVPAEALRTRGQLRKALFNVSWQLTGVAAGAWVYRAIVGDAPFDATALPIAAAVVAAAVLLLVNLTALSGVVSILTRTSFRHAVLEGLPATVRDNLGAAIIGLLVVVLVQAAPFASPLVLLLVLMLRQRHVSRADGYRQLAAERDRFERTVGGSSDGVALLDVSGRVEVWNPAMAELTGIAEGRALGEQLTDLGLSQLADGASQTDELRLALSDRVVSVRRSDVPGSLGRTTSTVVTVRDVSREAELARIRDDLVMRVSHELRTPLTSLEGFLEVLTVHWGRLDEAGRQELVQASRRGSRRLSRLVANLMVWAGIESRAEAVPSDVDHATLVDVLQEAVGEVEIDDVSVEVDQDAAVTANPDDLRTILDNLLTNAALYGAAPVSVVVRRRGDQVHLVVTDAGPGLPASFRPHLFQPFRQESEGLQRTAKGLGMGLAIVRSLATSNGGHVRFDDVPGGGARFTVTLPAAAQPRSLATVGASGTSSSSR